MSAGEVHIIQPRIAQIFTNGERLRRRFSLLVLFVFIRGICGSRTSGQDGRTAGVLQNHGQQNHFFWGSACALRGYGVTLGASSSHAPFFSRASGV
jgi:hypothetical protein